MMSNIKLKVEGQTLYWYGHPEEVAADSVEFVGFEFMFSHDWEGYTLHATFLQEDKAYVQLLEKGQCNLPSEIETGECGIGLFGYSPDGVKRGTTNLLRVRVVKSGFVPDGEVPIPPTPDLYAQLLQKVEAQAKRAEEAADRAEEAAGNAGEGGTGGGGTTYTIGHGLRLDKESGNLLSVDVVNDFGGDNTLPMSAAGVETVVGNIDVLLKTL